MPHLDYERSLPSSYDRLNGNQWGMLLPGLLMATIGWFCALGAAMANDAPGTKTGPLFRAAVYLIMATGPIGVATVCVSLILFRRRRSAWLWLNWLVPAAHFGVAYILIRLSPR